MYREILDFFLCAISLGPSVVRRYHRQAIASRDYNILYIKIDHYQKIVAKLTIIWCVPSSGPGQSCVVLIGRGQCWTVLAGVLSIENGFAAQ